MKKQLHLFFGILVVMAIGLTQKANAQAPQGIPYQAVARDNAGNLIKNQSIALRFSIHDGTANGAIIFTETHSVTTDALGLFAVNIGGGTSSGTLADVNWGSGAKFTQVESDVTGGSNFIDMGTTQMMSVPYALYAGTTTAATGQVYTIGLWPELGGYVFRISADGKHGLVAETFDQAYIIPWYYAQDFISNPANHSSDGAKFMDWRLPTKYELMEIFTQRSNIGSFGDRGYWSSTELNYANAWGYMFSDSNPYDYSTGKSTTYYVRAVRAF